MENETFPHECHAHADNQKLKVKISSQRLQNGRIAMRQQLCLKIATARSGLVRDKGRDPPLQMIGTRSRAIRARASSRDRKSQTSSEPFADSQGRSQNRVEIVQRRIAQERPYRAIQAIPNAVQNQWRQLPCP